MKIIVGLGNIGDKYAKTRHNCGFMAIDVFSQILEKEGLTIDFRNEEKFNALIARVKYGNNEILLVKPTTLMNNSGICIQKILHFYKETLENLTVIYDDIDLSLGTIRMREKGSAGTHNGMRSIVATLGTENIRRIRIGVGEKDENGHQYADLAGYVLSPFSASEKEIIEKSFQDAAGEIKKLI